MDIRGIQVEHIEEFGEGYIEECNNGYMMIKFKEVVKEFKFPESFEKWIICKGNKEVQDYILTELNKAKTSNSLNRHINTNADNIRKIVTDREIQCLYHFTRIENVKSIIENGLVPRNMHRKSGINAKCNDYSRKDHRRDCTSLSIGFPNYKLFYKFRTEDENVGAWVVLAINKDVLVSEKNICYFCNKNAGGIALDNEEVCDKLRCFESFENMFAEQVDNFGYTVQREHLKLNNNMTTDPQAEVMIKNVIDKKFIESIYFNNSEDLEFLKSKCSSDLLKSYNFSVKKDYFLPRGDYKYWEKRY